MVLYRRAAAAVLAAAVLCAVTAAASAAGPAYTLDDDLIAFDAGGNLLSVPAAGAVLPPSAETSAEPPPAPAPAAPERSALAAIPAPAPSPGPSGYDSFPRRLADMDQYERIAMEPYPDYDTMPLQEKASVYSRQFFLLRNREPNFSPAVRAEIDIAASLARSREDLYKPPGNNRSPINLDGISGPWGSPQVPAAGAAGPGQAVDPRMETLRGGWSLRGAINTAP